MVTSIIAFAAFFSFGYCVTDIVANYRANKRIETFVKEFAEKK